MTTLLADLKGPQLSILAALWCSYVRGQSSLTNIELAQETGYTDHHTITAALRRLSRRLMILNAGNPANRNAWTLTATSRQMFLPAAPAPIPISDGGNHHLAGSSSSLLNEYESNTFIQLLLLPPPDGGNHHLEADLSTGQAELSTGYPQAHAVSDRPTVVALLVAPLKALGCPEDRAIAAVTQALNRGETAQALAEKIMAGRAHAASPAGRSIHSPGHWLAACLADGRAIPAPPPAPVDLEDITRYDGYLPFADNAPEAQNDPK